MNRTSKKIQPHIMCGIGDVASYVLMPCDPGRVERIAGHLDSSEKISEYRGFVTYTGESEGVKISSCSTGIGCPSAAIAIEELINIGAETLIRVGTTGSLQHEIDIGDIIVATAAVRAEGTSRNYVPVEYPAAASIDVTLALIEAAEKLGINVHTGIVMSTDAYYGGNEEALRNYGSANVLSIEMEASTLFTLSALKRKRSGAVLVVDGNLAKGSGKGEFEAYEKTGELSEKVQKSIDDEIRIAIKACKILESS
jgi:uridine phosphorylase